MKNILNILFEGLSFPVVARGTLAYLISEKIELENINDIDIQMPDENCLAKFEEALSNKAGLSYGFGEYKYQNQTLPRKRIVLSHEGYKDLILDILIHKNYYLELRTSEFIGDLPIMVPSDEELLADNLISLSKSAIGIQFHEIEYELKKMNKILRRICSLQERVDMKKTLNSLSRMIDIQNVFYNQKVNVIDVIYGAQKNSKEFNSNLNNDLNDYQIDIKPCTSKLSSILLGFEEDKLIAFFDSEEKYGCFSNFSTHEVFFDDVTWKTSEHCYQAQKFINPEHKKIILNVQTPKEAAKLGRSNTMPIREDWAFIKTTKMFEVIRAKTLQNPVVYVSLLATRDKEIYEQNNRDFFWGVDSSLNGNNNLGKIFKSIRTEIF